MSKKYYCIHCQEIVNENDKSWNWALKAPICLKCNSQVYSCTGRAMGEDSRQCDDCDARFQCWTKAYSSSFPNLKEELAPRYIYKKNKIRV